MPDCGVHYLWFAFVCFLIRSHPPMPCPNALPPGPSCIPSPTPNHRPGYYGPACMHECPGGACISCSGHGTCDGGVQGTGVCVCAASSATGFFAGPSCSACLPGYYGSDCRLACPGHPGIPCGGHGACDDGAYGTGACMCTAHWAGAACDACASGFWGADCAQMCPGAREWPCSGHGQCDREQGCVCARGWRGPDCGRACPRTGEGICGGHGVCGAAGTCECIGTQAAGVRMCLCLCCWRMQHASLGLWMGNWEWIGCVPEGGVGHCGVLALTFNRVLITHHTHARARDPESPLHFIAGCTVSQGRDVSSDYLPPRVSAADFPKHTRQSCRNGTNKQQNLAPSEFGLSPKRTATNIAGLLEALTCHRASILF